MIWWYSRHDVLDQQRPVLRALRYAAARQGLRLEHDAAVLQRVCEWPDYETFARSLRDAAAAGALPVVVAPAQWLLRASIDGHAFAWLTREGRGTDPAAAERWVGWLVIGRYLEEVRPC